MEMNAIEGIDVHAHYGACVGAPHHLTDELATGDAEEVLRRARIARICLSIVSPLAAFFPEGEADPEAANMDAQKTVEALGGLLRWVVVDPQKPRTFAQAADLLSSPRCAGIKIHPELHAYHINDYGRQVFEFAEKHGAVVQSHSGEERSLPADFLMLADDFPGVRLIVSHLGCGFDGDLTHQVRAIQQSKHGNMFTDTSSAKSITPNLIEWAVREIGADRILFGTDTPLYFAPMQRARIDYADISDSDRKRILRDNAERLFPIPQDERVTEATP